MKDAKKLVQPGDLVAIHSKYKLVAGICKQWTDVSFQYFRIRDYKHVSWVKDYINNSYHIVTWTSYIRSRVERRVVPIKKDYLNNYEKIYYEKLKEELHDSTD